MRGANLWLARLLNPVALGCAIPDDDLSVGEEFIHSEHFVVFGDNHIAVSLEEVQLALTLSVPID